MFPKGWTKDHIFKDPKNFGFKFDKIFQTIFWFKRKIPKHRTKSLFDTDIAPVQFNTLVSNQPHFMVYKQGCWVEFVCWVSDGYYACMLSFSLIRCKVKRMRRVYSMA